MQIAGRTLEEWRAYARSDDCLDYMVPSDLRQILAHTKRLEEHILLLTGLMDRYKAEAEDARAKLKAQGA